jgi:CheY-like chemotaxis protein
VQMVADEMRAKHQSLVVDLGAARQTISGDPVRLRQVFWNLLRNAVKFTPDGGRVTIESWNNGGLVTVEIRDNGPGLGNDQIEQLFQPFQQGANARHGGLGLGLAIARGIVDLHQGKISASNRGPGSGACFIVHFPTVTGLSFPAEGDPGQPRLAPRLNEGIRILLVEDHRDTAEAFRRLLSAQGFDVRIACTMHDALKVDLAKVSLVISDVGLPDGDGPTLLRQLRRKRKVKAIALSGYGAETDIRNSLNAGFSAHLVKPITIAALVAAIHKALEA